MPKTKKTLPVKNVQEENAQQPRADATVRVSSIDVTDLAGVDRKSVV